MGAVSLGVCSCISFRIGMGTGGRNQGAWEVAWMAVLVPDTISPRPCSPQLPRQLRRC